MAHGRPPGLPKTGGRQKGTQNKNTLEIKELARVHGPKAIEILVDLMANAKTEATRVAAVKELLDRGYGKAKQDLSVEGDMSLGITIVSEFPDDQH